MTTETPTVLSVETLEESYDIIAPKIPEIVDRMYTRMFEVAPLRPPNVGSGSQ